MDVLYGLRSVFYSNIKLYDLFSKFSTHNMYKKYKI